MPHRYRGGETAFVEADDGEVLPSGHIVVAIFGPLADLVEGMVTKYHQHQVSELSNMFDHYEPLTVINLTSVMIDSASTIISAIVGNAKA